MLSDAWLFVCEILRLIAGPVITVFFGAFFFQKFFASRSNEAKYIDYLEEQLSSLRAEAFKYWTLPENAPEEAAYGQKLKGDLLSIYCDVLFYSSRYKKKKKKKRADGSAGVDDTDEYAEMMVKVVDACTGGGFESQDRKPDPSRYFEITTAINELKSTLFRQKL